MKKNKANLGASVQRSNSWGATPSFHCYTGPSALPQAGYLPTYMLFEFSAHNNPLGFTLQTAACELGTWKRSMWVRNDTKLQGKQVREGHFRGGQKSNGDFQLLVY